MADAMFTLDCREQFQLLRQHRSSEGLLGPMLEGMCNTLAMGIEEYIRGFDPQKGIELLAEIGSKNITTNGDAATMLLRCLGLILENVPRAIEVGFGVPSLVPLVRTKLANLLRYEYEVHSPSSLCEDALRVVAFLSEADTKGTLIQSGLMTEVAGAMSALDAASASRCLVALNALVDKLYLPPNPRGPGIRALPTASSSALPAATPSPSKTAKKGAGASASAIEPAGASVMTPLPATAAAGVRRELATRVVPALVNFLSHSLAARGESDRDAWPTVEATLECLETLVYRIAASAHYAIAQTNPSLPAVAVLSPWITPLEVDDEVVALVAKQDVVSTILHCLTSNLAHNEKRQLVVLSVLTSFARVNRRALRIPLLEQPVVEFFTDLLAPSKRDLSSLLANAFPKRVHIVGGAAPPSSPATGATSSLITTAAAQLLQTVFDPLPNSGINVHFRVMPVHTWQWADDMHTFTDYSDDACLLLETARLTMQPTVNLKVRNTAYRADLAAMRQVNPSSSVGRPIKRNFVPRGFNFVDWVSRINHMVSGGEVAGSGGAATHTAVDCRLPLVDEPYAKPPLAVSGAAADEVLTLLTSYGPMVMAFTQSASGEVHRCLGAQTLARMLLSVASPYPPEGFYRCLESLMDDLMAFLASVLSAADDLVTIDIVLSILHALFAVATQDADMQLNTARYSPNHDFAARCGHSVLTFARTCRRHGVGKKLNGLASRLRSKLGETASSSKTAPRATDKPSTGSAGALAGCAILLQRANDLEGLCSVRAVSGASPQSAGLDNGSFTMEGSEAFAPAGSPVAATVPLVAAVARFRELPDDGTAVGREAFVPELLRVLAASAKSLTVHEYSALHLTSALARYFCHPQDVSGAVARRRLRSFGLQLQAVPEAAAVLVSMLVAEVGQCAKRLPEAQSVATRAADKCRPWTDALQRLFALSPNIDLCCNKAANDTDIARRRSAFSDSAQRAVPAEEMKLRCPAGHMLQTGTTTRWTCDLCHTSFASQNSLGCRRCDFDICLPCHASQYRGGLPQSSALRRATELPGVRTHMLATVGDVDAFYRLPTTEREARAQRQSDAPGGLLERLERVMGLIGGHHQQQSADSAAAQLLRAIVSGQADEGGDEDDDGGGPANLRRAIAGSARASAVNRAAATVDTLPALQPHASRRDLWYAGLGRVGYQETIFGCFYRKAIGLGIGSIVAAFEDALMVTGMPQANDDDDHDAATAESHPHATPPRTTSPLTSAPSTELGTPLREHGSDPLPRMPNNVDGSPTSTASSSPPLLPPDTPVTRQRTYYFHVFSNPAAARCCCGELASGHIPPGAASGTAMAHAQEALADATRAQRNLASELPTNVAFRPPELTTTARFTTLRILWTLCVAAATGKTASDTIAPLASPLVPPTAFVSHDLSVRAIKATAASAMRVAVLPPQVALPGWLVEVLHHAPWLLSHSVQLQILHFLVGGARRALADAVQSHSLFSSPAAGCTIAPAEWGLETNAAFVNRPPPKEVLPRDADKFEAAALKTLALASERRSALMFEFEGDKGTGQGPTLQFFTKVAEQLSLKGRGLWRGDEAGDVAAAGIFVTPPPEGLFPAPQPSPLPEERRRAFYLCGNACARALLDGRLFPLPLSPAMFVALRRRLGLQRRPRAEDGAEGFRDADLDCIDRSLAQSMTLLQRFANQHAAGESIDDAVTAMELSFVLPGYEHVELIKNGADLSVTAENLGSYIDLVRTAVVEGAVDSALQAFTEGFGDVVAPDALLALDGSATCELVTGVGGDATGPLWTTEDLARGITGDHGYSKESRELHWLREIMVEMQPTQQRAFLKFATGCPRLPVGGLSALGAITVVKKDAADDGKLGLPSVNTCFRYLKLPPYPSKDAMKRSLLLAVSEAGDAFDLS
jgi:hypothetical protein